MAKVCNIISEREREREGHAYMYMLIYMFILSMFLAVCIQPPMDLRKRPSRYYKSCMGLSTYHLPFSMTVSIVTIVTTVYPGHAGIFVSTVSRKSAD